MNRSQRRKANKDYIDKTIKPFQHKIDLYERCRGAANAYLQAGEDCPPVIMEEIEKLEKLFDKQGIIHEKYVAWEKDVINKKELKLTFRQKWVRFWIFIRQTISKIIHTKPTKSA